MAMTKAEKAAMDALRIRCALNWPPEPPRPIDVKVELAARGLTTLIGIWWANSHAGFVEKGWSNGYLHGRGHESPDEKRHMASQGAGGPWFYTQADALRFVRHARTLIAARDLDALDQRIALAEATDD